MLHKFQVYNMICYWYVLQNDQYNKCSYHPSPDIVTDFSLVMRTFKSYRIISYKGQNHLTKLLALGLFLQVT